MHAYLLLKTEGNDMHKFLYLEDLSQSLSILSISNWQKLMCVSVCF